MIGGLLALGLIGLILFIMLAALALLAVAVVIKFIIIVVIQIRAGYKEAKAEEQHGEGSIGALIAEGESAVARGDLDKALNQSVDRKDAMKILDWFAKAIGSGDYYCIRESEPGPGEPDYAIVMKNRSGYDFKEFRCKATPGAAGERLSTVTCTAKDWKKNTEGQLWFHCKNPNVNRLSIEANDIAYEISMDAKVDAKRRQEQRVEDLVEIAENTKPDLATRVLGNVDEHGSSGRDTFDDFYDDANGEFGLPEMYLAYKIGEHQGREE